MKYAVPDNTHTHPKEGHWKFRGEGSSPKPNFFIKESLKQNWISQGGGGLTKKWGGGDIWIFSETTNPSKISFLYL